MAAILTEPSDAESCARCGATFACGARAGACWCAELPALRRLPEGVDARCLCPACLRDAIAAIGAPDDDRR